MLHQSESVLRDQATTAAKTMAKKKSRKYVAFGAAGALLLGGGAAYAYMSITGNATVTATAYQAQGLSVKSAQLASPLYPGSESDLVMTVVNPNPFPVKISQIAALGAPTEVSTGCDITKLGGPVGTNPVYSIPAADQVVVPGGQADAAPTTVTVKKAVSLNINATQGCGFKLSVKITGTQSAAANPPAANS